MAGVMRRWFGVALAAIVLGAPGGPRAEPVIVDIRSPAEWRETGVIADAVLLTFFAEDGSYDAKRFVDHLAGAVGFDAAILLICRTGRRTGAIIPLLEQAGFRHVDHIEGGITRWRAADGDLVMPGPDDLPRVTQFDRSWRCGAKGDARGRLCRSSP